MYLYYNIIQFINKVKLDNAIILQYQLVQYNIKISY